MTSERLAIVLIADQAYTEQLAVTMKSIMYHNKSVDFYIINQGIMPDWFRKIRRIVRNLGGELYNIPFDMGLISSEWRTQDHISPIAYAKYFISRLIDRDKVLYLDVDIVVNGSLVSLFATDLKGFPVGAVRDVDGSFNTGVMLIDNLQWKELGVPDKCLELSEGEKSEHWELEHFNGDQTILNSIFQDNWLELDKRFNVQVGHDIVAFYSNWQEHFHLDDSPLIIHYTTYRKPWNSLTSYRYREKWWDFYNLEFSQILAHHLDEFSLIKGERQGLEFITLTNSEEIEGIEYLANTFPEHKFHIAAYTEIGDNLRRLSIIDNIYLHPQSTAEKLKYLCEKSDAYLNINYGDTDESILHYMVDMNKPIFSFYATHKGKVPQYLFLKKDIEKMKEAIQLLSEVGNARFAKEWKTEDLFNISVMSIDETLDKLLRTNQSMVRFGDGEIHIMNGYDIPFQKYDEVLAQEMRNILMLDDREKMMICMPEVFEVFQGNFTQDANSESFWKRELDRFSDFFKDYCHSKRYGSAFISRPYIYNKDKSRAQSQFEKIKQLFEGEELLIVEGATSRSGVGNDLFDGAKSIKRIICPSHNAFDKIQEIKEEILEHSEGRLILLMLGPTAKVLAYQLSQLGYRALDLGHIDSEYEWMKMGAETKVQLKHKHTAEFNFDQGIEFIEDEDYNSQIVADLSK